MEKRKRNITQKAFKKAIVLTKYLMDEVERLKVHEESPHRHTTHISSSRRSVQSNSVRCSYGGSKRGGEVITSQSSLSQRSSATKNTSIRQTPHNLKSRPSQHLSAVKPMAKVNDAAKAYKQLTTSTLESMKLHPARSTSSKAKNVPVTVKANVSKRLFNNGSKKTSNGGMSGEYYKLY